MSCRMSSISSPASGSLQIKWDPKNLEIRTKSVEKTLEPLVTQVNFPLVVYYSVRYFSGGMENGTMYQWYRVYTFNGTLYHEWIKLVKTIWKHLFTTVPLYTCAKNRNTSILVWHLLCHAVTSMLMQHVTAALTWKSCFLVARMNQNVTKIPPKPKPIDWT